MKEITINVLEQFSDDPWGRYRTDNPVASGEEFRERFLIDAFSNYDKVVVDFNGLEYLPDTSFLGEAFVGLVKHNGFSYENVRSKLEILSDDEFLAGQVDRIITLAMNEMNIFNLG